MPGLASAGRAEGTDRPYVTEAPRRQPGFSAGCMQRDFHHGPLDTQPNKTNVQNVIFTSACHAGNNSVTAMQAGARIDEAAHNGSGVSGCDTG